MMTMTAIAQEQAVRLTKNWQLLEKCVGEPLFSYRN
jgi:hypothetical protein